MYLAISSMLVLAATTPQAARPASCASGLGQSGYDAGYSAQSKVLAQVWSDLHEFCDQFDLFKNKVKIALSRDPPDNVFLRCRRAGMMQAFDDAITRIGYTCISNCAFDLEPYTTISAQLFCDGTTAATFAQTLQRKGVAVPTCGINDRKTCKEKVQTKAEIACSELALVNRSELETLATAACESPE
jgi:hypothetical protein